MCQCSCYLCRDIVKDGIPTAATEPLCLLMRVESQGYGCTESYGKPTRRFAGFLGTFFPCCNRRKSYHENPQKYVIAEGICIKKTCKVRYNEIILYWTLRRCGTCRVGGTKLKDFPITFETFIFTNSKKPKISDETLNFPKIWRGRKVWGHGPLLLGHDAPDWIFFAPWSVKYYFLIK